MSETTTMVPEKSRGKGWVRSPHRTEKLQSTRHLFGARSFGAPREASLEQFVDRVRDQGATSACVGFALARAFHVRLAAQGASPAWPSPTGIYTVARAEERERGGGTPAAQPLQDQGSDPLLAFAGMQQWGVPADSAWPPGGFDPARIDDEPMLDELEAAAAFQMRGGYEVDSNGPARVSDVCQALAEGYPVCVGVEVDQAFEDLGATDVAQPPDPGAILGGHMLCVVGYRTTPSGLVEFRVCNSWGTSWADGGLCWASSAWLCAPGAGDILVFSASAT